MHTLFYGYVIHVEAPLGFWAIKNRKGKILVAAHK
jgi:hypothetical protein